jgi:hypothetical protein
MIGFGMPLFFDLLPPFTWTTFVLVTGFCLAECLPKRRKRVD